MQRALSFLFFLPAFSFPILAQDGFPRYEIFGGGSLISSPVGLRRDVFNGWSAEFTTYFRKEMGATVSISRQYGNVIPLGCFEPGHSRFYAVYTPKLCTEGISVGLREALAGPRFTASHRFPRPHPPPRVSGAARSAWSSSTCSARWVPPSSSISTNSSTSGATGWRPGTPSRHCPMPSHTRSSRGGRSVSGAAATSSPRVSPSPRWTPDSAT